jgi:hypothetical protein
VSDLAKKMQILKLACKFKGLTNIQCLLEMLLGLVYFSYIFTSTKFRDETGTILSNTLPKNSLV